MRLQAVSNRVEPAADNGGHRDGEEFAHFDGLPTDGARRWSRLNLWP